MNLTTNIITDLSVIYLLCGMALLAFLKYNDLYFFTNSSYEDGSAAQRTVSLEALMVCINIGITVTSIVVWPLVLAACLNLDAPIDE